MKKNTKNFNLVEVILAMGIVVVCITSIFAMFAAGLKISGDAASINYGTLIAEQIAGRIESDPTVIGVIPETQPTALKMLEETFTTPLDGSDDFFKNVLIGDTTDSGILRIEFKTSLTTETVDFTAIARVWYTTPTITTNSGFVSSAGNTLLNIEVIWPAPPVGITENETNATRYINRRILEGDVTKLELVINQ